MPSPKKSVSPKKKTVSPKKTVSKPKMTVSPKKSMSSSKPKLTDTHKAIAAASLLALLGGGALAYKNREAIRGSEAYKKVMKTPGDVNTWLGKQTDKVKDLYEDTMFVRKTLGLAAAVRFLRGKDVSPEEEKKLLEAPAVYNSKI
jgi:hypothetical protein